MLTPGWGGATMDLWGTPDGGTTWYEQLPMFQPSDWATMNSVTWTWTAGSSFGEVDIWTSGWSQARIFGYTLEVVPEPSVFALLGLGVAALVACRRRK